MKIAGKSLWVLLFSLPFVASSQERQAMNKLGIDYSADYSYRNLKSENSYFETIITERDKDESPVLGFHSGLTFLHQFKFGLTLEGGVQYVRFGMKDENIPIVNSNAETIGTARYVNYYDYFGIPVKVGYGLPIGERITLSASTGISTNYFVAVNSRQTKHYDDGKSEEKSSSYKNGAFGNEFENWNFVSVSSIGVEVQLVKGFSIRFEPSARFFLKSTRDNTGFREKPFSYGLNTTVFYRFHKKEKSLEN